MPLPCYNVEFPSPNGLACATPNPEFAAWWFCTPALLVAGNPRISKDETFYSGTMKIFRNKKRKGKLLSSDEINALICGNDNEVEQAFDYLFHTCYGMVYKWFRSNSYSKHELVDCGEIFADVLTDMQIKLKRQHGTPVEKHGSYLRESVHSIANRLYKQLMRNEPLPEDSHPDVPVDNPRYEADHVQVAVENGWDVEYYALPHPEDSAASKAFWKLEAMCRQLIAEHILDQQPFETIAARTGVNLSTLKSRFGKCFKTFKTYFHSYGTSPAS